MWYNKQFNTNYKKKTLEGCQPPSVSLLLNLCRYVFLCALLHVSFSGQRYAFKQLWDYWDNSVRMLPTKTLNWVSWICWSSLCTSGSDFTGNWLDVFFPGMRRDLLTEENRKKMLYFLQKRAISCLLQESQITKKQIRTEQPVWDGGYQSSQPWSPLFTASTKAIILYVGIEKFYKTPSAVKTTCDL